MRILFLALLYCASSSLFAQGINFLDNVSWEEVKKKANAENKYIFVDVYATWCGPCKEMEKNVYVDPVVGSFMNDYFISIKVQVDTSGNDDASIKSWYKQAKNFSTEYNIKGLPTYLFFSPAGTLVDRNVGYAEPNVFRKMATNAMIAEKQYYTLVEQYVQGRKNYKAIPGLADKASAIGDTALLVKLTDDYMHSYWATLPSDQLLTAENLEFASRYNGFNSKERIFQLLFKNQDKANELMHDPKFANNVIDGTIKLEELYLKLWQPGIKEFLPYTKKPNWGQLASNIEKKYGKEYAEKLTPQAQLIFYFLGKDWASYVAIVKSLVKKYPPQKDKATQFGVVMGGGPMGMTVEDQLILNESAWRLFQLCPSKSELKEALSWSELSLKLETKEGGKYCQYLDTKANLLYKLGRQEQAIALEEEAIRIDEENYKKQNLPKGSFTDEFIHTLNKMKKGEQTWPVKM